MRTQKMHVLTILNMVEGLEARPERGERVSVRYSTAGTAGTVTCRANLRLISRRLREAGYWGWLPVAMTSSDWARMQKAEGLA